MASSMLHYTISNLILKEIQVGDRERFLLGASLGPDASSHEDGSYVTAHYIKRTPDDTLKGVLWTEFSKEYEELILSDDFVLGYYCHLIMDAVWLHDMSNKYVRCYQGEERNQAYQRGYRDYDILNYLLIKEYNLRNSAFDDTSNPVTEISEERLVQVKKFFEQCFNQGPCKKEDLDIYKWDKIQDYIKKSIALCVSEIKALRNGLTGLNPEELYVNI